MAEPTQLNWFSHNKCWKDEDLSLHARICPSRGITEWSKFVFISFVNPPFKKPLKSEITLWTKLLTSPFPPPHTQPQWLRHSPYWEPPVSRFPYHTLAPTMYFLLASHLLYIQASSRTFTGRSECSSGRPFFLSSLAGPLATWPAYTQSLYQPSQSCYWSEQLPIHLTPIILNHQQ